MSRKPVYAILLMLAVFTAGFVFLIRAPMFVGYDIASPLLASVFPASVTAKGIHKKYAAKKLKILIVPGHDNHETGAQFGNVKENDLTLGLARHLLPLLQSDSNFDALSARDVKTGEFAPEFSAYFTNKRSAIERFRTKMRGLMRQLVGAGIVKSNIAVSHNTAPTKSILRLYGINKWANEHNVDIVIHIHFNDSARRRRSRPGKYSGFTIFVPESQYPNAEASIAIGSALLKQFKKSIPTSDAPGERGGFVEDQKLIAVGANATRKGVSFLIEYGYIYEPQFAHPAVRDIALKDLAFQTYVGLKKYFEGTNFKPPEYTTVYLPYLWTRPLGRGLKSDRAALSLQAALFEEGLYPPSPRGLSRCPINGNFGPCTEEAVKRFQEKYHKDILSRVGLSRGTGFVGLATIPKLNELYGK